MTAEVPPVAPSNVEQHQSWDGETGAYWTAHAERFDRSVARYHERFLTAAAIAGRDRVLDIGCGTGRTTRDAARAAAPGSALGIDLSAAMLAYARQRAADEGVGNVTFEQADAQVHRFEREAFNLAMSRTGAMFFGDPVTAFTNIAGALRPGGRLVLMTWQGLGANEWFRSFLGALAAGRLLPAPPPDAPGPFSLAEPDSIRAVLGAGGFDKIELVGASEPMWFGADADDAAGFVGGLLGWLMSDLDDDARARALDALHATMAEHETAEGVVFSSGAWIITAVRPS